MERFFAVLNDTDFKRDSVINMFAYFSQEALEYYRELAGEKHVDWDDLPDYVRNAVHALDAAADEHGDARIAGAGSRSVGSLARKFIAYDITNPTVKEVTRESA